MKRLALPRNQRGDTIVEVLIVLAVLSLAFAISLSTATKSFAKSRGAEEHSQGQGLLDSQVEILRAAVAKQTDVFARPGVFCLVNATTYKDFPAGYTRPSSSADSNANYPNYPAECVHNQYHVSITYNSATSDLTLVVRWQGVGGLDAQQEVYTYRTHALTATNGMGIPTGAATPQIKVVAKKIPPLAPGSPTFDPTPPCSNAAINDKAGTTVRLIDNTTGVTVGTQSTDASSTTLFQNLTDFHTYSATATGVPAGYQVCTGSGGPVTAVGGTTGAINLTIRPMCNNPRSVRDYYGYYGDYIGTYGDYIGTYGDYIGTYSDIVAYHWDKGPRHGSPAPGDAYYTDASTGRASPIVAQWFDGQYYYYELASTPKAKNGTSWYNVWVARLVADYGAPYDHYGAPYNHYGGAYDHYGAPYNHYGAYYTVYDCPS